MMTDKLFLHITLKESIYLEYVFRTEIPVLFRITTLRKQHL